MPPAASTPVVDAGARHACQDGIDLPLKGRRARLVSDALLGVSAAVAQYVFVGLFLAIAFKPAIYDTNPALEARLIGVAFAIGIYAFGRWGRRRIKRAARRDEGLTVFPDRLIVRHEALLTAPVTIHRDRVELVAIDDGSPPADSRHRFRIRTADGSGWAWIWTPERRSLPMLDPLARAPNLLLRFREPVDFPARRRRLDPAHRLPGSKELGLLVRVKNPQAAAQAFAAWESCHRSGRCSVICR
jgi:hypothetical protein